MPWEVGMLLMGSWELVKLVHRAKPGQVLTRLEMSLLLLSLPHVHLSEIWVAWMRMMMLSWDVRLRVLQGESGHPSVQVAHRIAPSQQILGTAQWIIGHAGTCSPAFHRMVN